MKREQVNLRLPFPLHAAIRAAAAAADMSFNRFATLVLAERVGVPMDVLPPAPRKVRP